MIIISTSVIGISVKVVSDDVRLQVFKVSDEDDDDDSYGDDTNVSINAIDQV